MLTRRAASESAASLVLLVVCFAFAENFHVIFEYCFCSHTMDELAKLLASIELLADNVIDTKQQIINLDARRHKTREASAKLREYQSARSGIPQKKHWVCIGDMFIKLNTNQTRNLILDDQYHLDEGVEKLREELKERVIKLNELEGKPEVKGFTLKPLKKEEILALRTGFRI